MPSLYGPRTLDLMPHDVSTFIYAFFLLQFTYIPFIVYFYHHHLSTLTKEHKYHRTAWQVGILNRSEAWCESVAAQRAALGRMSVKVMHMYCTAALGKNTRMKYIQ
jgi:hypothetical protein